MKKRFIQTNKKSLYLLVLIFTVQFVSAQIVAYDMKVNKNATAGSSDNFPGKGRVINLNAITQTGSFSQSSGQTCFGWLTIGTNSWVTSQFSTKGYKVLTGSFQMKASATGPKYFKIQYSLDGTIWNDALNVNYNIGSGIVRPLDSQIELKSSFYTYNFSLPQTCENNTSVYVRWVLNSTMSLNGTNITSSKSTINASIIGVSIAGNELAAPSTQASNISIISVTPISIKIGCTTGNGDRRIIKINTVNSFTDPLDNDNVTGNSFYGGTGEQTVYNGTGTSLTVIVPSSKNQYWFRVYDYNALVDLTRYNTSNASGNPKLCKLENIHSPTSSNIRLINATLGATIDTPTTGTINERGFYWDITSPVDETGYQVQEITSNGGVFSLPSGQVARGTTIYFKGYVTNESGTIMSEESSFSNIPIFSGTGSWETPSLWNVKEIPGSIGSSRYGSNGLVDDSPVIDGNCTLNVTNSVTDITINPGKSIIINTGLINTGNTLNVDGTLTNNGGNTGIIIKSAKGKVNGSLVWTDGNPAGTVEMYSKSFTDTKYHWQYFGIPVTGTTAGSTFGGTGVRVRRYNESNFDSSGQDVGLWLPSPPGGTMATTNDAMSPVVGYEVTQPNDTKNLIFTGMLNHSDFTDYPLSYTPGANWTGNNIIANPFTSAIRIGGLSAINTDGNVYLYNSGSRDEWTQNGGATADGEYAGQYTASNGAFAGTLGMPAEISSMQGFLVKATRSGATITIPYSAVTPNTTAQRAPQVEGSAIIGTRIDVTGTNYSDKMWIFTSDNCTKKFDRGYDAAKITGSVSTPQIYAIESDGDYQIDAVNDMNNTLLSFQPGSESTLTLKFTHQNIETKYANVYLVDLLENKTVDVTASGAEYPFTAVSTSAPTNRFKIVTTPLTPTSINTFHENSKLKIFSSQGSVFVQNFTGKAGIILLYNMAGVPVRNVSFNADGITEISNISAGIYIAKAKSDIEEVNTQLIIR